MEMKKITVDKKRMGVRTYEMGFEQVYGFYSSYRREWKSN